MSKAIKSLIGGRTMYRLMMSYLMVVWLMALILSVVGVLAFSFVDLIVQTIYIGVVSHAVNYALGRLFRVNPNFESTTITSLILTLIVGPVPVLSNWVFLTFVSAVAVGSKYIIRIGKRHIFNPAAFGVTAGAFVLSNGASWWAGNIYLLPVIIIGGLLIASKISRWHLILSFLTVYFLGLLILLRAEPDTLLNLLLYSPLGFFMLVMLVEPLTAPNSKKLRIAFGAIVAFTILIVQYFFTSVYYSLELSLLVGNLLAFAVSTDPRLSLTLRKIENLSADIYAFWFEPEKKFNFTAGQFLEITLPHPKPDNRGLRRFMTIASSPTEDQILITTRISDNSSSFKKALLNLKPGGQLSMASLDGEFTLPKNTAQPLAFIAGGIGITPFRSMIKSLLDAKSQRDIYLIYAATSPDQFVFKEMLEEAQKFMGLKLLYVVSDPEAVPNGWSGQTGYVSSEMVKKYVPNYVNRLFYVSGPSAMVKAIEQELAKSGLKEKQIKHDYFPGYA